MKRVNKKYDNYVSCKKDRNGEKWISLADFLWKRLNKKMRNAFWEFKNKQVDQYDAFQERRTQGEIKNDGLNSTTSVASLKHSENRELICASQPSEDQHVFEVGRKESASYLILNSCFHVPLWFQYRSEVFSSSIYNQIKTVNKTMTFINYLNMKAFMKDHQPTASFSSYLKGFSHLESMNLDDLNPSNLHGECQKINQQKFKRKHKAKKTQNSYLSPWRKGEFKIFAWFSSFYLFSKNLTFRELVFSLLSQKNQDFEYFRSIFVNLTPLRLRYEVRGLFSTPEELKCRWEQEQIQLLQKLVLSLDRFEKKIQWKAISFKLFSESSEKYFRSYGKCREMWVNHLDPEVIKKNWTLKEDLHLMELVEETGKKWSKINSKIVSKRSDHMIKNRYNSIIRQFSKRGRTESQALAEAIKYLTLAQKPSQLNSLESLAYKNDSNKTEKISNSYSKGELNKETEIKMKEMLEPSLPGFLEEEDMKNGIWVPNLLHSIDIQSYGARAEIKPVMLNLTEKLGFPYIEPFDVLFQLQKEGRGLEEAEISF